MTINPDTIQSDAIKRLEACKVTDADIKVIKKCKKLQDLCVGVNNKYSLHNWDEPPSHKHPFPCQYFKSQDVWLYTPTFEQMIALIGDRFSGLIKGSKVGYKWKVIFKGTDKLVEHCTAPTARQALSMACEFVLGGKDLRSV